MNPLSALLEVSLYFLKFIEYKNPLASEEVRHSSLLRIWSKLKELFFTLLPSKVIELMIDQGPPQKFLPGAPQLLSAAMVISDIW
jgi:hypothetical protein